MKNPMQAKMYSVKPFPEELRANFRLPANPYHSDIEVAKKAYDYLQGLGVIRYQDEAHPGTAVLIQPLDDDPTDIEDRRGFFAFEHGVVLDKTTAAPTQFEMKTVRGEERRIKKYGDLQAWKYMNRELFVAKMSSSSVDRR